MISTPQKVAVHSILVGLTQSNHVKFVKSIRSFPLFFLVFSLTSRMPPKKTPCVFFAQKLEIRLPNALRWVSLTSYGSWGNWMIWMGNDENLPVFFRKKGIHLIPQIHEQYWRVDIWAIFCHDLRCVTCWFMNRQCLDLDHRAHGARDQLARLHSLTIKFSISVINRWFW